LGLPGATPGILAATFRRRRFFLAPSERPALTHIQLISSYRCKMGCNCGRRPAAPPNQGPGPRNLPRSVARPVAHTAARPAPAPAPAPTPVPVTVSIQAPSDPEQNQVAALPIQFVTPTVTVVPSGRGGGLDTSLWGPSLWLILHTAAQNTKSIHQRLGWIRLLPAMKSALPCDECSAHYNAWITANPVSLPYSGVELQVAISSWILALHNDINRRNDVAPWTLEQVAATYTDRVAARAAIRTLKSRSYISAGFLEHLEYLL
jgi:hypothetical protein